MLRTVVALSAFALVAFSSCSQDPIQEELINHAAALRPDGYTSASVALAYDSVPTARHDDDRMELLEPDNFDTNKPVSHNDDDRMLELEPDNFDTNKPDGYVDDNAPVIITPLHTKTQ